MLDFLPDLDLGVFSQIALIECTTDGDLEYIFFIIIIFIFFYLNYFIFTLLLIWIRALFSFVHHYIT